MSIQLSNANFEGVDGPYLINDKVYYVNSDNEVSCQEQEEPFSVKVDDAEKDQFSFSLIDHHDRQPSKYEMPQKIIAVSDIEGNFNALSSLLYKNEVIDKEFNWIFGENHFVVVGDILDRDKNVMPVVWLLYKLEKQAERHGGKVHVLLGNHEIMNIQAQWRYAADKYHAFAQYLAEKTGESVVNIRRKLYSENSEVGRWLRSKNVVERIGNYLFVHAGLHPQILKYNFSLDEINTIVRENIDRDLLNYPAQNNAANFLMGSDGPFWYRGYVMNYARYNKVSEESLDKVLHRYNSERQIIGHSQVADISKDFNGKVVRIDVRHGSDKYSKNSRGLLIENEKFYKIDATGRTSLLK